MGLHGLYMSSHSFYNIFHTSHYHNLSFSDCCTICPGISWWLCCHFEGLGLFSCWRLVQSGHWYSYGCSLLMELQSSRVLSLQRFHLKKRWINYIINIKKYKTHLEAYFLSGSLCGSQQKERPRRKLTMEETKRNYAKMQNNTILKLYSLLCRYHCLYEL